MSDLNAFRKTQSLNEELQASYGNVRYIQGMEDVCIPDPDPFRLIGMDTRWGRLNSTFLDSFPLLVAHELGQHVATRPLARAYLQGVWAEQRLYGSSTPSPTYKMSSTRIRSLMDGNSTPRLEDILCLHNTLMEIPTASGKVLGRTVDPAPGKLLLTGWKEGLSFHEQRLSFADVFMMIYKERVARIKMNLKRAYLNSSNHVRQVTQMVATGALTSLVPVFGHVQNLTTGELLEGDDQEWCDHPDFVDWSECLKALPLAKVPASDERPS